MRDYIDIVTEQAEEITGGIDADLLAIATKYLHIRSFEMRGSDSLDFHDVSVGAVREALAAAYALGQQNACLDEGVGSAIKHAAIGAAALMGSHNADAASVPANVDPEIVAASGDTRHSHRVIPQTGSKADKTAKSAPKSDAQKRADRFHLKL